MCKKFLVIVIFIFPVLCMAVDWLKAERNIQRLKPNQIKQVPEKVMNEIRRNGCEVPQVPHESSRTNVIHGHFAEPKSDDWAILCSKNGDSFILVVWENGSPCENSVARSPDRDSLQDMGGNIAEFSRKLLTAKAGSTWNSKRKNGPSKTLDHEGIIDEFVEKGSSAYYCEYGQWLNLVGDD